MCKWHWIYKPERGLLAFPDLQSQKNFTSAAKCNCKRNVLYSPASAEDGGSESDGPQWCLGPLLGVRSRLDLVSGSSSAQGNVSQALQFVVQFSQLSIFLYLLRKGSWTGNHFMPRLFPDIRWPCRLRISSLEGLSKVYHLPLPSWPPPCRVRAAAVDSPSLPPCPRTAAPRLLHKT